MATSTIFDHINNVHIALPEFQCNAQAEILGLEAHS